MTFLIWVGIFLFLFLIYVIYTSHSFQVRLHKIRSNQMFLDEFIRMVKGKKEEFGYFAPAHKVISLKEYASFSNRQKANFSSCYNIVRFHTQDAIWELFFHLVKEGAVYNEIMTLRVFPKNLRIKSEGNIEKSYGRINIFTNNRYLTNILESRDSRDYLGWLLRHNNDILLVMHNNLHYKAFIEVKKFTATRAVDMVKSMNILKNKIYRHDVIEY